MLLACARSNPLILLLHLVSRSMFASFRGSASRLKPSVRNMQPPCWADNLLLTHYLIYLPRIYIYICIVCLCGCAHVLILDIISIFCKQTRLVLKASTTSPKLNTRAHHINPSNKHNTGIPLLPSLTYLTPLCTFSTSCMLCACVNGCRCVDVPTSSHAHIQTER